MVQCSNSKKLRNYTKAEECLQRSVELNSEYVNALVNLGNLKNETYFFDNAISYYNKALNLNKNLPLVHLNMSSVYQSLNKINEAKEHLNKALLIDEKFTIACKEKSLRIIEIQKEGKNKMLTKDFLLGIKIGS